MSTSWVASNCLFSCNFVTVNAPWAVAILSMKIDLFKAKFNASAIEWKVNTGQESSQDKGGVTPCQVSSAPPGRSAMAKGTTYIWPRHKGTSAVCSSLREICLPTWIRRTNTPTRGVTVCVTATFLLSRGHICLDMLNYCFSLHLN